MAEEYILNLSRNEFMAVYGTFNLMLLNTLDTKELKDDEKKDLELDYYRLRDMLESVKKDSIESLIKKLDMGRQQLYNSLKAEEEVKTTNETIEKKTEEEATESVEPPKNEWNTSIHPFWLLTVPNVLTQLHSQVRLTGIPIVLSLILNGCYPGN